jgi:hypothetical protein
VLGQSPSLPHGFHIFPCQLFICFPVLHHMTSNLLVQVVEISLKRTIVRRFSTSVTPAFYRRRTSMASRHLRGEYPVWRGISVSRSSDSVMVSLNDPFFMFQNAIFHIQRMSTLWLLSRRTSIPPG